MADNFNLIDPNKKPSKQYHFCQITRVTQGKPAQVDDKLAIEEPLAINVIFYSGGTVKKSSLSITMRTPGDDYDLVRGFLFTEGIIGSLSDIIKMETESSVDDPDFQMNTVNVYLSNQIQFAPDELTRHFYTSSSCGVCGKSSIDMVRQQGVYLLDKSWHLDPNIMHRLLAQLEDRQVLYNLTGGNHVAFLFDKMGNIVASKEDVGRHNALDKLIGHMMGREKLPFGQFGVLVSGRASFELIQKAWLAGIPILCAIGAPSSLAVTLADEVGMTVVGFLKKEKYNLYTHPFRVAF